MEHQTTMSTHKPEPPQPMRIITVYQPWASLIAMGAKRFETRRWQTVYRGPLAIHAAAHSTPILRALMYHQEPYRSVLGQAHLIRTQSWGMTEEDIPYGAIIAICDLVEIVPIDTVLMDRVHPITQQELAFGHYEPGEFAWKLVRPYRLPTPIPCRGRQGIWTCPPDIAAQLLAARTAGEAGRATSRQLGL